jgi:hypothetical protein
VGRRTGDDIPDKIVTTYEPFADSDRQRPRRVSQMNQRMFEELARERRAEVQRLTTGPRFWSPRATTAATPALARTVPARAVPAAGALTTSIGHARDASRSLRARAGWRLVDLGLKLVVQPDSRPASSPRPAGS